MNCSVSTDAIGKALAGLQAEVENIAPNQTAKAGTFEYDYADLPSILSALRPKLKKHGLAIVQTPINDGGAGFGVHTLIIHESGQWIDCGPVLLPSQKQTAQGAGACITYARRYAVGAVVGIATEEDDDAISHENARPVERSNPAYVKPPSARSDGDFDKPLGFGKFKDRTWREMTEGSIGGARHDYLTWLVGNVDPDKDKYARERFDRAQKCLAIIGKRADMEAAQEDE